MAQNQQSSSGRGSAGSGESKGRETPDTGGSSGTGGKRGFAQDRERASDAGRKGGESSHGGRDQKPR